MSQNETSFFMRYGLAFIWIVLALGSAISGAEPEFSGQLISSSDLYISDLGPPTDRVSPYLLGKISFKQKWNRSWRLSSEAYVLSNPESESSPENFYFDFPEGFLEWRPSPFGNSLKLRVGLHTLNWGVVDLASPMDVTNTQAIFHPLRSHKQGAAMLETEWKSDSFGIHAVYIPISRQSVLPSTDSRWLPRKLLLNTSEGQDRIILPSTLEYTYEAPEELDHALTHSYGVRLNSHLERLDLYAMHFDGPAPSPKVRPTITLDAGSTSHEAIARSPIELQIVSYRIRTTGIGAVWAGDHFIARVESAYEHTVSRDPLLQPWSWSNVLALESNFDVGSRTLTVLGQYYYSKNPQASDNFAASSYRLFDRTLVLGGRLPINDDWLAIASILWEQETDGLFWMVQFENKISDSLRWSLAWRDLSAVREGLIKTFANNDHATLELNYYF